MDIFSAIILGIIEGLTEFLPISSTGHLIVAQDALSFYDASRMFTVVIQIGAIAAVMWFYRQELVKLINGLFKADKKVINFWLVWVIATLPAGILGLIFDKQIESHAATITVAIALILGGIAIWLIENYHKTKSSNVAELNKISKMQAIKIGFYQAVALIPGVSRSGATIMGGMLSGLDRVTATAFSFYLGIPILLLASIYKLTTGDISSIHGGWPVLIVGIVTSFFTALFVVGWLLKYVSRHNFKIFAYYRILFGLLLLLLIKVGLL